MSESLVEKLNRIEKEIDSLKNKSTPKPINYQEGISLLEEANKNLDKILSDLNKRYELLEQKFNLLNNKKPVDYSGDIKLLNKELAALKNKKPTDYSGDISKINKELAVFKNRKPVKQIDYSEDIKKLNARIDPLIKSINEIKNKSVTPLIAEKIKTIDHSKELSKINGEIANIKKSASNEKDINLTEEIKKIVNLNYVNKLYRK